MKVFPVRVIKQRAMNVRRSIGGTLFLLVLTFVGFGATLSDYKDRIESARFNTEELFQNLAKRDADIERELIAEIEKDVPVTETVEWPGGSVETDNGWLRVKLKAFTDEPDRVKRGAILTQISELLLGISVSAGDLDKAAKTTQTKDQDKQKLNEILRREEYQKPEPKGESLFQKWWREFLEWLRRVFPSPDVTPGTSSGLRSLQFGLQILIGIVVIGFLAFAIYKFIPFFRRSFRYRKSKEMKDRIILGERIGADESASGLFSEAEQLAREGNLRAAIRKGYIALLCDLSDRKIVRLARHKTNRDYLRDVRKNENLFEDMNGLTQAYESNWYGLRLAEQADWENFRTRYRQVIADQTPLRKRGDKT